MRRDSARVPRLGMAWARELRARHSVWGAAALIVLRVMLPLAAPPASAHAVVTETSLKERPVKAHAPARVIVTFNTAIEVKLSRAFLVSKGDVQTSVPIAAGPKPGSVAVELPALAEGDYALRCRVFATDGHLTEEIIRFRVGAR